MVPALFIMEALEKGYKKTESCRETQPSVFLLWNQEVVQFRAG